MMNKPYALLLMLLALSLTVACQHKNLVLYQSSDSRARLTSYGDLTTTSKQNRPSYQVNVQSFDYGFGRALMGEEQKLTPFIVVNGSLFSPTGSGFLTQQKSATISTAALLPSRQAPYSQYSIRPKVPIELTKMLSPMLDNYKDLTFLVIEADVESPSKELYPALILIVALRDQELLNEPKDPLFNPSKIPLDNKPILRGAICRLTDRSGIDLSKPETFEFLLSRMEEFSPNVRIQSGELYLYLLKEIEDR